MNIKIYISCNDLPNSQKSLELLLKKVLNSKLKKHEIIIIREEAKYYEYPALKKLYDDSKKENFYGLYLHCKGSSKTDIDLFENGLAWSEYMLYGLLDNVDTCLDYLNRGADIVGSMWYRHFKGNFFWFRSDYIKTLQDPYEVNILDRYIAEYWVSQGYWYSNATKPRIKNLFYLPINSDYEFYKLKEQNYIPNIEEKTTCSDIKSVIFNNDYRVFDIIKLSGKDVVLYGDKIADYMNFDCELIRTDL